MEKKLRPVTVLGKVKLLIAEGSWLEVSCLESAAKIGTVMRGEWSFDVITPLDGTEVHKSQVVTWRTLEQKTISTIVGLTALAIDLDIHLPEVPLFEGEVGVWKAKATADS